MMRRVAFDLMVAAGVVAWGAMPPAAEAATGLEGPQLAEVTKGLVGALGETAEVTLHYIQEDGPESGHVRVVLVPEARPLTQLEARVAAQQAFLATLKEPGLGDPLKRITVVVRLMPNRLAGAADDQVIVFLHKGGNDWSVVAGE
jgi:hypothetical protein